ncbi:MAG: flagellar basal body rod protein FlgB [Pseudomonadota bacterium]|nr:flagellar basal body rod protein FlgB [Pseudomonadota bacterium]
MDYSGIPLFSIMKAKLEYMSERQSVLAQNVANADTPGYKAVDIPEPDFGKMVSAAGQGLPMAVTSPGHISTSASAINVQVEKRKSTYELNPDGNNVSVEEEMAKIGQNQMEYQKVLGMYGKMITLFKTAIGNTSGG